MRGLLDLLCEYFSSNLQTDSCCFLLRKAEKYDLCKLRDDCVQFFGERFEACVSNPEGGFLELPYRIVLKLLQDIVRFNNEVNK